MGATGEFQDQQLAPRSLRHKRILDIAAEQPDASFESIAQEVPSATSDLVENVLEEYGDPAEESGDELVEEDVSQAETTGEETYPDPSELNDIQLETLRAILENPDATQRELGDILGISGATVNSRVNSIPEFEWEGRLAFAEMTCDADPSEPNQASDTMSSNETPDQVSQLSKRIQNIEQHLETQSTDSVLDNPELAHKVMHACLSHDEISEKEELEILKAILG
jgi:ribosomal protein S15P/S13E